LSSRENHVLAPTGFIIQKVTNINLQIHYTISKLTLYQALQYNNNNMHVVIQQKTSRIVEIIQLQVIWTKR